MFVRNKQHLVVDCYPPAKVRLLWLTILLLLAALGWSLWGYAPAEVDKQLRGVEQQRLQLMERLSSAESERVRFQAEVEHLETMQGVDRQAYDLLQENFNTLQHEIVEMKQQLAFYQAVVAPDQAKEGLKIQRFSVEPAVDGRHAYSLVLIQARKTQTMVQGTLYLEVRGSLGGRQKTLKMAAITEPATDGARLRFRYFQNISGYLRFPARFVPERVKVKLNVKYPHKGVGKSYSWTRLQG